MRLVLATLLFVWLPLGLWAQPVPVQTGEHATFTRVVVRLPVGADWDFGRDADGYVLRTPVTDGYDLRRFYDLIPDRRITAVSQDAARGDLRLAVSCACRADVFLATPRFLVIDVADGPADPASPFERWIDPQAAAAQPATAGPGVLPVVFPDDPALAGAQAFPLPLVFAEPPLAQEAAAETDDLAALEQIVVESLGRGLTTGVLQPDIAGGADLPAAPPHVMPALPLPGISVSTGVDLAAVPGAAPPPATSDGTACVPDSFVDLAAWADDRPFAVQIAAKRSALVQEFDRFDSDIVLGLARVYAHFGFGREAIQTLTLDREGSMERTYLRLVSQILDDEPINYLPDIAGQISCPSQIALWAFLASPPDRPGRDADRAAILRTFKNVPPALQGHLGPRLATRFAAIGDEDAADQVLRMARHQAPDAIETRLMAATLAGRQGDDSAELDLLTTLAQTEPRITPEAMIRFLQESARQQIAVPTAEMVTADALRFEHAQTSTAVEIAVAQIAAYMATDSFAAALDLFGQIAPILDPDLHHDMQRQIDLAAAARMPDAEFLGYFLAWPMPLDRSDLRDQVAERLIELGFPDQALRVIGPEPPGADDIGAHHLRAAALIDLDDPNAALRILGDDNSARAAELRAAARAAQAGDAPSLLGDISSQEADWRSGNWAELAQSDDPLLRGAGAAVLQRDEPVPDAAAPLASGRILLDDAAQSRALLDALLNRFAPPEDF
jgi:hypothetical protein